MSVIDDLKNEHKNAKKLTVKLNDKQKTKVIKELVTEIKVNNDTLDNQKSKFISSIKDKDIISEIKEIKNKKISFFQKIKNIFI